MNETKSIYQIWEQNLEGLRHQLDILNRRATKLGVPPIVLRETGNVEVFEHRNEYTNLVTHTSRRIEVELTGATPKFEGWTLAATLEHTEEGNIIRKVPSCAVNLMPFKSCKPNCEHCNLIRNRRDTYLVLHDTGTVKQIGHDCIRDFLGHKSPQHLAAMAELLFSAGELCGLGEDYEGCGGGSGERILSARTFLGYCARAIRQFGYVSRKAENEDPHKTSTKSLVFEWLFPPREERHRKSMAAKYCLPGEKWPTPSDDDFALVDAAREFVVDRLSVKTDLNEFENNILIAAKLESLELRTCGIAAYVVEYYRRETERAAEQAKKQATANNTHFGELKKRYRGLELTYLGCFSFDSQFGTTYIHRFENAEGQRLVWKTGTELGYADGHKVKATFTVKEHGDWKGWAQTKVSRLEVLA
jgi:hypothetical protein